ncbi:MAG: hypothetical protein ACYDD7_12900, partial [Acidimicrobiales bacterium]
MSERLQSDRVPDITEWHGQATSVGYEIDRNTVTWAVAHLGNVCHVDQISADTPKQAIAEAMRNSPRAGRAIVAWEAPSAVMSERVLPIVPNASQRSTLDAAVEDADPDRASCARLGDRVAHRNELSCIVGLADSRDVAAMWASIDRRDIELVTGPMVLSEEGIWLGIHRAAVDLTIVADGLPGRSRRIASGGLEALAATLGRYGGDGRSSLERILAGGLDEPPDILRNVDEHVAALCAEVSETLASWRRNQRLNEAVVYVYGPGSALPTLEARFTTAGINPRLPPSSPQLAGVDAPLRARAWIAIQAALVDSSTFIGFADRTAEARRAALMRLAKHSRRAVTMSAIGGIASIGLVVPIVQGRIARNAAVKRLADARCEIRGLGIEERVYSYVEAAVAAWTANAQQEPDWAGTLGAILKSAPPTVSL